MEQGLHKAMQAELKRAKTEIERLQVEKVLLLCTTDQLAQQTVARRGSEVKWSKKLMQGVQKDHIENGLRVNGGILLWCLCQIEELRKSYLIELGAGQNVLNLRLNISFLGLMRRDSCCFYQRPS